MTATVPLQSLIAEQFGIQLGPKNVFSLWMECQRYLEGYRKTVTLNRLLIQPCAPLTKYARRDLCNAMANALIGDDWPDAGCSAEEQAVFIARMRDAMRRRGFRVPRAEARPSRRAA